MTWVSAVLMIVFGSVLACFFTLGSVLSSSHCDVLDYSEQLKDSSGMAFIYPDEVVSLLNTCLYDDDKNVAKDIDILAQSEALKELHSSAKAFVTAT